MSPTYLSLFSGIGGLDLGLDRAGFTGVGQGECDPFAAAVLERHWPGVQRWRYVRHLLKELRNGRRIDADFVVGGFTCTDISVAGKGAGIGRETRSGLYWQLLEVVCLVRPRGIILENVPALRTRGADAVLSSLEARGYAVWPTVVGAEHVGAPHRRHQVFLVGWDTRAVCRFSEVGGCGRCRWCLAADMEHAKADCQRYVAKGIDAAQEQAEPDAAGPGNVAESECVPLADADGDGLREQRERAGGDRAEATELAGVSDMAHPDLSRRGFDQPGRGPQGGTAAGGDGAEHLADTLCDGFGTGGGVRSRAACKTP